MNKREEDKLLLDENEDVEMEESERPKDPDVSAILGAANEEREESGKPLPSTSPIQASSTNPFVGTFIIPKTLPPVHSTPLKKSAKELQKSSIKADEMVKAKETEIAELKVEAKKAERKILELKAKIQKAEMEATMNSYNKRGYGRLAIFDDGIAAGKPSKFEYSNERMSCRCEKPCTFMIKNHPSIRTTSPSQYFRMLVLLELNPEMVEDPTALMLLAQPPSNVEERVEEKIKKKLFMKLAVCPSFFLMTRDTFQWTKWFDEVNMELTKKLMNHGGVGMGGVWNSHLEEFGFRLNGGFKKTVQELTSWINEEREKNTMSKRDLLVLFVPIFQNDSEFQEWKVLVEMIPAVWRLMLVPAPTKLADVSEYRGLAERWKTLKDDCWLKYDDVQYDVKARSLLDLCIGKDYSAYWTSVNGLLSAAGFEEINWRRWDEEAYTVSKPARNEPTEREAGGPIRSGRHETNESGQFVHRGGYRGRYRGSYRHSRFS